MISLREEADPDVAPSLLTIVRALRPPRTPASAKAVATTAPASSSTPVHDPDPRSASPTRSKTMIGHLGRYGQAGH